MREHMIAAVVTLLEMCQRLGLPFQKIDLEDAEAIEMFAMILEDGGATPEMLKNRAGKIGAMKVFPCPGSILELLERDIELAEGPSLPDHKNHMLPPLPGEKCVRWVVAHKDWTPEQLEAEWHKQNPDRPRLDYKPEDVDE